MAKKTTSKKPAAKPFDQSWENDPSYPEIRGICYTCKQRDDLKLAYDRVNYICKNSHACMLRFAKRVREMKG